MFAGGTDGGKHDKAAGLVQVGGPHVLSNGCVVCGLDQNGDSILLCDGCDGEYHTYCLVPPLTEIPEGDFYCKKCTDANLAKQRETTADVPADTSASAVASSVTATASSNAAPVSHPTADSAATVSLAKATILMKDSKYRGVSKVSMKGVKKPFVAKLWQGSKYLQFATFASEIEAAHAYDKAALMHYGKSAQLNFPNLHECFTRPKVALSARSQTPAAANEVSATAPSIPPADHYAFPGRGRGRSLGRGRGRGRGKRLQDSPDSHVGHVLPEMKRRKLETTGSVADLSNHASLCAPVKKYLGVQVHRVYAHAQIHVNGKVVNLGTFPTAKDAALAYDKAALKYFGGPIGSSGANPEKIVLNFPEKRDELLKELLEEENQKLVPRTTSSSYAARNAQNTKYNLSIMKLNAWASKLQRSIKMVEASQRIQWGLHMLSQKKG
ncbi:hypothetical protein PsorP6_007428 [Peronosclerospora sorghi]|uniref:Uncharacterized protein n=1 Tax=Peronosclerospora sorghi TaxID=230839 RepID=A0ACC0WAX8_9STRA|nr:hypothetical protein PsorP6_007428 [Peronosclerospora sorghi]